MILPDDIHHIADSPTLPPLQIPSQLIAGICMRIKLAIWPPNLHQTATSSDNIMNGNLMQKPLLYHHRKPTLPFMSPNNCCDHNWNEFFCCNVKVRRIFVPLQLKPLLLMMHRKSSILCNWWDSEAPFQCATKVFHQRIEADMVMSLFC